MEIEHSMRIIQVDEHFNDAIAALKQEGWERHPDIMPQAVFHLVRAKKVPVIEDEVKVNLEIDDSKVMILRNGKLLRADGTEVAQ